MAYKRRDRYHARAKEEGLRSRAAYKLDDLARGVIRRGDRVVDLGAWPGGWLQSAAKLVGPTGWVVGVDLVPIDGLDDRVVRTLVGDVTSPDCLAQVKLALGGEADTVVSDMAPKLTGIRASDQARSGALGRRALEVAAELLRPGGSLIVKLFMGADDQEIADEAKRMFTKIRRTRPPATRSTSSELYLIATGLKPRD